MYRTSACINILSDGYETRFWGESPKTDPLSENRHIEFHTTLSSRAPYYSNQRRTRPRRSTPS